MRSKKMYRLALLGLLSTCMGMMTDGCQGGPDFSPLAGLWTITRGATTVKFTFTVNNGGEVTQNTATAELGPLDPNDFPAELAGLVDQWNNGLVQLNANLDAALPDQLIVTFPASLQIRLTDPNDTAKVANGLINKDAVYIFVGDLSGAGEGSNQGGGAVLQVASVEGSFDTAQLTTTGVIARRLAVVLIGSNNSALSFVVEITVAYTGQRVGDTP